MNELRIACAAAVLTLLPLDARSAHARHAGGRLKIVAYGDSITLGVRRKPEERFTFLLQQRLEREMGLRTDIVNAGLGECTSARAAKTFDKMVLAHKPDYVIVEFGWNDTGPGDADRFDRTASRPRVTPAAFRANLVWMLGRLQARKIKAALLVAQPLIQERHIFRDCPLWKREGEANGLFGEYRKAMVELGKSQGLPVCDAYKGFESLGDEALGSLVLPDGIHPSAKGHALYAALLLRTFRDELLDSVPVSQCQISVSDEPGCRHAAQELREHITAMSGIDVPILPPGEQLPATGLTFVVGAPVGVGQFDADLAGLGPDAYVIRSVTEADRKVLLLAGANRLSTHYAVYHYLERFCDVGFFRDGDHVPRRTALPFGMTTRDEPTFGYRADETFLWHVGLRRSHAKFWRFEEWKKYVDFVAKKRNNHIELVCLDGFSRLWGQVFYDVCPECRHEDDDGWIMPPRERTALMTRVFDYARLIGLKIVYGINYGSVNTSYQKAHPDVKVHVRTEWRSLPDRVICIDQPQCRQVMTKVWKRFIEVYGTDHLYWGNYRDEARLCKGVSRDRCFREMHEVVREIDPQGKLYFCTWSIRPDALKRATSEGGMPRDVTFIDYGRWRGGNWAWKVKLPDPSKVDLFAGRAWIMKKRYVQFTGDTLQCDAMDFVKEAVWASRVPDCVGYAVYPETSYSNFFITSLVKELGWSPDRVAEQMGSGEFVREYVRRRYGRASTDNMTKSYQCTLRGARTAFPSILVVGNIQSLRGRKYAGQEHFREALIHALKEAEAQRDNDLYATYVTAVARTYLNIVFAWFWRDMRDTYEIAMAHCQSGDIPGGDKAATQCVDDGRTAVAALDWFVKLLDRRPEFWLAETVHEMRKVEGANNPHVTDSMLPRMLGWNYHDTLEYTRDFVRPMAEDILAKVRKSLSAEVKRLVSLRSSSRPKLDLRMPAHATFSSAAPVAVVADLLANFRVELPPPMPKTVPVPKNLATGKRATASSWFHKGDRFTPQRAIDGTPIIAVGLDHSENCWATEVDQTKDAWWQLDFGEPTKLTTVSIWFRNVSGYFAVPRSITFQVSDDGRTWQTLLSRTRRVPRERTPYKRTPYAYAVQGRGRYLRLLFEDGSQTTTRSGKPWSILEVVEVVVE